jgi:hypothetical protein
LVLLPYFLVQRQSEVRESRKAHIHVKLMNAAQQIANCQIKVLQAGQREVSAQHSAVEAELLDARLCESDGTRTVTIGY